MRQYYPTIGGIQNVVSNLAKEFIDQGHEINIIALNRLFDPHQTQLQSKEQLNGVQIYRIPYWGSKRYPIAPAVVHHLKQYDLIHLHSSDFFLDYLSIIKFTYKAPLVFTSHGLFFHTSFAKRLKNLYFNTITRLSLRNVTAVACVSQQDYQQLSQITPSNKLFQIPNGVSYKKYSAFPIEKKNSNLFISIGNLSSSKGHNKLLERFAYISQINKNAKLIIIGQDKGELHQLKTLCNKLGINESVQFAGKVNDQELVSYLSEATFFLSASAYEGFGIALLEAMASGCIPIVQTNPAHNELVQNKLFLTDFYHPQQAEQQIKSILSMSAEEKIKTANSMREKSAKFSWTNISKQYEKLYTTVLGVKNKNH